ncbi:uncharacterized lipoprotein YddW (UPF0748 family) [Deinobacterium chartae]|uniref:Uncharacterized lipoprotein YddW (UPF0748 family) n=1 Tax=Deinobacterium chartae TaxID=521158 RepID=A0A841I3W0_9DEIO|nr:family 10 glycosylhydrolase [Deinobacterium chartae]MBB6098999.1 uncharacterized lipoprotein YddW (UPF0748 family) [Deinobacterium chartae]
MLKRAALLLSALLCSSLAQAPTPAPAPAAPAPQLRGLWVDAFSSGIKTPAEIDRLVAHASRLGINVLFAQVGRRMDCYCNRASVPRTEDPAVPAGFDPLEDLIRKAHAQGIQVHAWMITTAAHNFQLPAPKNPRHVLNEHGLDQYGSDNWLTAHYDGTFRAGNDYVLDPGHPDAARYIAEMYASVVRNYDVDGIMLDRVRYPDDGGSGASSWGYNERALQRYRQETGTRGTPTPDDPAWLQWRREQVTALVRRIYLEVKSARPDVWVSASTITYGAGPANEAAFRNTRTYREVLQDWPTWNRRGYLDLNVMMNYKRQSVTLQARWFDQWNSFAAQNRGRAKMASGSALYLNTLEGSAAQLRAVAASKLDGWAGYAYRSLIPGSGTELLSVDALRTALRVLPPRSAWGKPEPVRALRGELRWNNQQAAPGIQVELWRGSHLLERSQTDGLGSYGFVLPASSQGGPLELRAGGTRVTLAEPPRGVTRIPTVQLGTPTGQR